MPPFAAIARQELQQVYAELSVQALFKKYEQLQKVVALYEKDENSALAKGDGEETPSTVHVSRFERAAEPKRITRGVNPDRDEALRLAAEAIKGFRTPIKTAEIYDVISRQGAKIGGTEPKSNLSAMLHHSEVFRSHGRKGWTLAEYDVRDDPNDGSDRASPEPSDNVTSHYQTMPAGDAEEYDPEYS